MSRGDHHEHAARDVSRTAARDTSPTTVILLTLSAVCFLAGSLLRLAKSSRRAETQLRGARDALARLHDHDRDPKP